MKLLIFASKETEAISKLKKKEVMNSTGGWVDGIVNEFLKKDKMEICICYPSVLTELQHDSCKNLSYYELPKVTDSQKNFEKLESQFVWVINQVLPDIILIFGTEHLYQCKIANLCSKYGYGGCTIIWIQGLVSNYYLHYQASLPDSVMKRYSLKDLIKRHNLYQDRESFYQRGKEERKAICSVGHVIGRTDWDQACVWSMRTKAKYHFCNETLKECFYSDIWTYQNCEKHSIFISQSTYPIKGFHMALQALAKLKQYYPDVKLYTTGRDVCRCDWKTQLKLSAYEKYIRKFIIQNKLEENVVWLGSLSGEQMKQQYLKANVYVSASSIENSPNSMGEAMLLGVPCVVSDVGGVRNLLTDKQEGFVYAYDDPDMLAFYVHSLFQDETIAAQYGYNARKHAMTTHSREKNMELLNNIFMEVLR